ncbi:MAG TPA: metalloregulator ArsR/SmtB family transcription factor [Mobilitalea sp.]|nr:metalloregulator ArsR/SmtB family transcription factor [Mobilitalea sp.]
MTENEAIELFKCISDRSRLQILKSLSIEPMYVERLAERLSLTPSTISFHLKKLESAGIVYSQKDQYYQMYHLKEAVLKENILDLIKDESTELDQQKEREENYAKKVIENFFEYGKLKNIPAQRKKRLIVLKEILKEFEVGKKYSEKEVNLIIANFHDDFCTLRREMIIEKLLDRNQTEYWRIA